MSPGLLPGSGFQTPGAAVPPDQYEHGLGRSGEGPGSIHPSTFPGDAQAAGPGNPALRPSLESLPAPSPPSSCSGGGPRMGYAPLIAARPPQQLSCQAAWIASAVVPAGPGTGCGTEWGRHRTVLLRACSRVGMRGDRKVSHCHVSLEDRASSRGKLFLYRTSQGFEWQRTLHIPKQPQETIPICA